MVLASGASRLKFIDEYRVFFGEDNPQLVAFDAVQDIYTKNDNILFVVTPPDGDGFSPEALAAVEEPHRRGLEDSLHHARRVCHQLPAQLCRG